MRPEPPRGFCSRPRRGAREGVDAVTTARNETGVLELPTPGRRGSAPEGRRFTTTRAAGHLWREAAARAPSNHGVSHACHARGTSSQVAGHSQQRPTVSHLAQSALQGDWNPLVGESRKASGKHWAEDAKCDGQDTEIFFPTGDGPQEDPVETAKRLRLALVKPLNLCASCPLATAARCLVESLRDNEEFEFEAASWPRSVRPCARVGSSA